jgi:hypothetical protein
MRKNVRLLFLKLLHMISYMLSNSGHERAHLCKLMLSMIASFSILHKDLFHEYQAKHSIDFDGKIKNRAIQKQKSRADQSFVSSARLNSSSIFCLCIRRIRARSMIAFSSSSAGTSGGTGVGLRFLSSAT